jgi:Tfp pilus assembly protein PilP
MGNADSVSAVFGLLLGLVVHNGPVPVVATADAAPSGPLAAIEKAHTVADAESQRSRDSDAQAVKLFAPSEGSAAAPAGATSDTAVASRGPDGAPNASPNVASDAATDVVRPPIATSSSGKYDPSQHRDPFRPPNLTSTVAEKEGPHTPLEGYEIGQLKLVGIVKDAGIVRAMVEDSAGLGYIVTTGTPIGSSGGVVRSIEQRRMLIQEMTTNFYGEKQAKEVVMELPQEDRSP